MSQSRLLRHGFASVHEGDVCPSRNSLCTRSLAPAPMVSSGDRHSCHERWFGSQDFDLNHCDVGVRVPLNWASYRNPGRNSSAPAWPGCRQDGSGTACCCHPARSGTEVSTFRCIGQSTIPRSDSRFAGASVQTRTVLCWLDRKSLQPSRFCPTPKTMGRTRT